MEVWNTNRIGFFKNVDCPTLDKNYLWVYWQVFNVNLQQANVKNSLRKYEYFISDKFF